MYIGKIELTQARAACQETLVEVFIIYADCFDEGGVHADHSLPQSGPATSSRKKKTLKI